MAIELPVLTPEPVPTHWMLRSWTLNRIELTVDYNMAQGYYKKDLEDNFELNALGNRQFSSKGDSQTIHSSLQNSDMQGCFWQAVLDHGAPLKDALSSFETTPDPSKLVVILNALDDVFQAALEGHYQLNPTNLPVSE